jgi:hypothetical protein
MSYLNCENANIPEHVRGFLNVFLCVKKKQWITELESKTQLATTQDAT